MNKQYYRLLLDDYSAASFTSFDKSYFGTLEQIDSLFFEHKADGELREQLAEIISIYDRYMAGEKKITHNVATGKFHFWYPQKFLQQTPLCWQITYSSTLTHGIIPTN